MNNEQIISNALSFYRRFGYTLFFLMIVLAVGGLVLWSWYAIPIAIFVGILVGQIYSNKFYADLAKRTGLDNSTLRLKMMEADAKRKGLD